MMMWLTKCSHKIKQILAESGQEHGYNSNDKRRITSDITFLPFDGSVSHEIIQKYVRTGLYKTMCKFRD